MKPYLSNFVSIPTFCLSHNPHLTFANNLCLNPNAAFAKQLASQSTCGKSTCDCDLHICKQLVSQDLRAIVSSSAFCKQFTSQDCCICDCNLQCAADHSDACTKHAPQNQSSQGLLNWNPATTSSRLKPGASAITCDLICCCCSRGWNYPGLNHS